MQQSLVYLRPLNSERDAWEWENAPLAVHKAYRGFDKGKGRMMRQLFGLAVRRRLMTLILWKKNVPTLIRRMCFLSGKKRRLRAFAHIIWAS